MLGFSIDLHRRPYNTLALPCECVIVSISETTTPIDKKFQDNILTTKMCPAMQYFDLITNPTWRTAANLKIAKSQYISEKSSDFDKIWYTKADIKPDDSHVTKNLN